MGNENRHSYVGPLLYTGNTRFTKWLETTDRSAYQINWPLTEVIASYLNRSKNLSFTFTMYSCTPEVQELAQSWAESTL